MPACRVNTSTTLFERRVGAYDLVFPVKQTRVVTGTVFRGFTVPVNILNPLSQVLLLNLGITQDQATLIAFLRTQVH